MRKIFIFLALFLVATSFFAQSNYFLDATFSFDLGNDFRLGNELRQQEILLIDPLVQPVMSNTMVVPLEGINPFLTVALGYDSPMSVSLLAHFAIRFSADGEIWTDWIRINEDLHFEQESRRSQMMSQLIFADKTAKFFQVKIDSDLTQTLRISKIELFFSAPGNSKPQPLKPNAVSNRTVCSVPSFQGRSDWCSLGECPFGTSTSTTNVTHLIVHHSAGSNTSTDWAATVRSIWHYHVDVKGWDDIGYNWLIDPNGFLYQGRKDNIRGAHFSGHNTGTMGICLLGNFHNASPKVSPKLLMIDKLEKLLCWKAEKENINPLATKYHAASMLNLKTISGHRDGGATDCPGDSMYIQLPQIRLVVDSLLHPIVHAEDLKKRTNFVRVYPTLAQNSITIEYTSAVHPVLKLDLFTPAGIILERTDFQEDRIIDIAGYPLGVYYVRLYGDEVFEIFKFIKN